MDLGGRRVLVTGASRGIGEALARRLAERGAVVALVARSGDAIRSLAIELSGTAHPADLTDPAQVRSLIGRVEDEAGPIDVLVNNAGIDRAGWIGDASADDVEDLLRLNLITPIELCRQLVPRLVERERGQLVNISSFAPRVEVAGEVVVGEPIREPIDIVLYDTYGREGIAADALRSLSASEGINKVAVFTFAPSPVLEQTAMSLGAAAVLPKTLSATELVAALEAIAEGREPVIPNRIRHTADERYWPGRDRGLTERESEVVVLLAQGLRNQEIASALYVSIDTVKTHLRAAFRKLGVTNRAQATAAVLRDPAFGRVRI